MFRRYLSLFAHDPSVGVDSESDFVQYIHILYIRVLEFVKEIPHTKH